MELAPQLSRISTNDVNIQTEGTNIGLAMGARIEYDMKPFWKLTSAINLDLSQGGTLLYKQGGNFFIQSDLKNPNLNHGPFPIPNETSANHSLKSITFSTGLKRIVSENDERKWYITIPILSAHQIFNSRVKIYTDENLLSINENVLNDLNRLQLALGTAVGYQHRIGRKAEWYTQVELLKTLTDLTKNTGFRTKHLFVGDPSTLADDLYNHYQENSKASITILSIKIGLLF